MDERINILFEQLKKNDMSAFDEFYQLTKRQVYFSIFAVIKSSSLSEDIMQDTYVKFIKSVSKIDSQKNVTSYLITIGKNLCIDYLRKNSRVYDLESYDNYEDVVGDTPNREEGQSDVFKIMRETLNDKEFEIVILHVVDEMTHKEIAKHIGRPLGSVTWAYNNAMKKLRKRMEREK